MSLHLFTTRCLAVLIGAVTVSAKAQPELTVAQGLSIEVFAEVPNPRQMAMGKNGTLFVGTRRLGTVFALPKPGPTGKRTPIAIAKDLNMPAGVAIDSNGHLYIAATHEIKVIKNVENAMSNGHVSMTLLTDQLPNHNHHGWKHIKFSPEGQLVIPVGMPCNVCLPEHRFQGTLQSLNLSTGVWTTLATGVRNSIGFDWRASSGRLWFSDNGRDWLGDDLPHDEINHIKTNGQHFGFPFFHGDQLPETDADIAAKVPKGTQFISPAVLIPAHSAPLGLHFYQGNQLPKRYKGALFAALHGSWNRSSPSGYLVNAYWFDANDQLIKQETVVEGFLSSAGKTMGRPVDFLEMSDGSLLISDDYGGRIWRLYAK